MRPLNEVCLPANKCSGLDEKTKVQNSLASLWWPVLISCCYKLIG